MIKLNKTTITNKLYFFPIIIGLFTFLILIFYLWNFTIDDAFISFRFALHLAQGYGLVWNIGGLPAEGYSNFLWVLLSAFAISFKIDPVLFTRIMNSIALIGIVVIFWKLSNEIFKDKSQAYLSFSLAIFILLSNPNTAIHFLSGLETFTYTFFILLLTFLAYKIIKSKNYGLMYLFSIIGLLTGLLRYEGFIITLGLFALILIIFKKYQFKSIKNLIKPFSLCFILPIAIYMMFRLNYFHELFPLPFLVKSMTYGSFSNIITNFSLYYVLPILLIVSSASYYAFKNKITENKYVLYLLIVIISVICANLTYIHMALLMNYAQRFFYPSLVLLFYLSAISIVLIKNNMKNVKFSKIISIMFVILLITTNIFISDINFPESYSKGLNNAHLPLGKSLEEYSSYNYTLVSIDAGAIPYFSKWKHIDLVGLTDVSIAKNKGISYEYLTKNNPTLIILISDDGLNPDILVRSNQKVPYEYAISNDFTKLPSIKFNDDYYLIPYLDPNIKDYKGIYNTLNNLSEQSYKNN